MNTIVICITVIVCVFILAAVIMYWASGVETSTNMDPIYNEMRINITGRFDLNRIDETEMDDGR